METQNAQINVSAEFVIETKNQRTEVSTYWFKVEVTDQELPTYYLGMSKSGEWLSCNVPFFSVDTPVRNKVLTEVRRLQRTMK